MTPLFHFMTMINRNSEIKKTEIKVPNSHERFSLIVYVFLLLMKLLNSQCKLHYIPTIEMRLQSDMILTISQTSGNNLPQRLLRYMLEHWD